MAQDFSRAPSGAHANSGPTSHSNVPGHANFTKQFSDPSIRMNAEQVQQIERSLGAPASRGASHANSGPTTHSNVPGHANFTKQLSDKAARIDAQQLETLQSGFSKAVGGKAASHANSGPTTHSNVPGHANFSKTLGDPGSRLDPAQVQQFQNSLGAGLARGASHANSGPTTHSNVPGHANFTKTFADPATRLDPAHVDAIHKDVKGGA